MYIGFFFLIVFVQGTVMIIIGSMIGLNETTADLDDNPYMCERMGLLVAAIGFLIETIADAQLYHFKKNTRNEGNILTTGLWKYSRHPNYFGEIVFWWGLYLMICGNMWGFTIIYSPIIITLMIIFITGISPVERRFKDDFDYQEYKKRTSCLIPWFLKKVQTSKVEALNDDSTSNAV